MFEGLRIMRRHLHGLRIMRESLRTMREAPHYARDTLQCPHFAGEALCLGTGFTLCGRFPRIMRSLCQDIGLLLQNGDTPHHAGNAPHHA